MAEVATESILNMIISDMRAIFVAEDEGFRQMIKTFHPDDSIRCAGHTLQLVISHALKHHQITKRPPWAVGSDVPARRNSTISMVARQLAESWPLIVTLSDATVTHGGKQYLDLRAHQSALRPGYHSPGLSTRHVCWSGEGYVTVSALLPVAREQLKSTELRELQIVLSVVSGGRSCGRQQPTDLCWAPHNTLQLPIMSVGDLTLMQYSKLSNRTQYHTMDPVVVMTETTSPKTVLFSAVFNINIYGVLSIMLMLVCTCVYFAYPKPHCIQDYYQM